MEIFQIDYLGGLRTRCTHACGASFETDAPKDNQGKGESFSPTDLVAVGLGSCMLTIMAITAKRLGVDLKGTSIEVKKEMATTAPRRIGRIVVRFQCPSSFSSSIQSQLERAAIQCPVHHSLHPEIKQDIEFIWGNL